jgi:hypothetical protein
MRVKFFIYASTLIIAFAVLFASILRTASVKYESTETSSPQTSSPSDTNITIDYFLPYPGSVLPDNPFWPLKALRDRVWLLITTNPSRKVELKLLFADKRLGSSRVLYENGKIDIAMSTLTKAEKYLEEASFDEEVVRRRGIDTTELLFRLANSSLKHYQVIQGIAESAPPEDKPLFLQSLDYPKRIFDRSKDGLLEKAETPPENPFDW